MGAGLFLKMSRMGLSEAEYLERGTAQPRSTCMTQNTMQSGCQGPKLSLNDHDTGAARAMSRAKLPESCCSNRSIEKYRKTDREYGHGETEASRVPLLAFHHQEDCTWLQKQVRSIIDTRSSTDSRSSVQW